MGQQRPNVDAVPGRPHAATAPAVVQRNGEDDERSGSSGFFRGMFNPQFRQYVDPKLAEFYNSMSLFQPGGFSSYYWSAINPLAIPLDLLRNREQLDPSLGHLRKTAALRNQLKEYTDPDPQDVLSPEQLAASKMNLFGGAYGTIKRVGLQSLMMHAMIKNPRAKMMLMAANLGLQFGGQALLKDVQIQGALRQSGLSVEHIDQASSALGNKWVKDLFGKPHD